MKKMRNEFEKVLLGATKEGTLVFANISLSEGNRDYFSVSFDEVRPFLATIEFLRERFSGVMDCYDKADKYDFCERFNCRPSELEEVMFWDIYHYGTVEDIVDISLYSESYSIDGYEDDVYFESDGCGQNDTRDRLIPIDPEFSEWLHNMWDKYHLQTLSGDYKEMTTEKVKKYLDQLNEEEWIKRWLEENKNNL